MEQIEPLPQEHYSTNKIIQILHSITKLEINKFGELEIWFDEDSYPSVVNSFIPGSFTRELIELIEFHLGQKE